LALLTKNNIHTATKHCSCQDPKRETQINTEYFEEGEIIENGNPVVVGGSSKATPLKMIVLTSDLKAFRERCKDLMLMSHTAGFYDNPLNVSTQTLKLQKRVLGPEHPDTLRAMHTLGVQYYNDKKFAEAIAQLQSVQKLREKVLGPTHTNTLTGMEVCMKVTEDWAKTRGLGARKALAKLLKARNIGVELFNLKMSVLGATDPDVIALEKHLISLTAQCNTTCQSAPSQLSQLKLGVKIAKKTCDQFHPNTAQIVFDYAHACKSTAPQAKEHITRMKEALLIIKKVCGDQHPETMEWRDILAHWEMDWGSLQRRNKKDSKRLETLKEGSDKSG
jgi:hypothetical protein